MNCKETTRRTDDLYRVNNLPTLPLSNDINIDIGFCDETFENLKIWKSKKNIGNKNIGKKNIGKKIIGKKSIVKKQYR